MKRKKKKNAFLFGLIQIFMYVCILFKCKLSTIRLKVVELNLLAPLTMWGFLFLYHFFKFEKFLSYLKHSKKVFV